MIHAVLLAALVLATAAAAAPAQAPEFRGIGHWINSPPLSLQALRGKVVLIDFWTYSCINCLRTLPHLKRWHERYADQGLVIVGVHSPEFDFEKDSGNVEAAVKRLGITWPVAMDNDMATWNAWSNRYWPAEYLVGRDGDVLRHHYGEGRYAETEAAIRAALGLGAVDDAIDEPDFSGIGSPEMYFGLARVGNLVNIEVPPQLSHRYTAPATVPLNRFALDGRWRLRSEYAELAGDNGLVRLRFRAGKLHMVVAADVPATLDVSIDGHPQPALRVDGSRMVTLFDSDDYREHVAEIRIRGKGFRAYTFTFG